jgi:autotransporter passenger strand-loop-strand repeat protein
LSILIDDEEKVSATQTVFNHGVYDYAQIYGKETISHGGLGYGDTVYSGGKEFVYGVTSGAIISSGGSLFVSSGGTVSASTLRGGTLTVSSGGSVSGGLTISSGTANISGTVATGQTITFAGSGGDLALYPGNLATFHATIGGFSTGDKFDLGGFAYSASETRSFAEYASHTSGLLTVTDGAEVAKLTLLGNNTSSDFALSNDSSSSDGTATRANYGGGLSGGVVSFIVSWGRLRTRLLWETRHGQSCTVRSGTPSPLIGFRRRWKVRRRNIPAT